MVFTYSGDPSSSDQDEVRFLLGDTDGTDPLFQDAEIKYAINRWGPLFGSNVYTAAVLAETAAAQFATSASYSADGVSVTLGPVGDQLRALAAGLRAQYSAEASAGVEMEAGGVSDCDGQPLPKLFGIGMDDDIEAGRQDYGERRDWH